MHTKPTVTTDQVVTNRTHKVIEDALGIVHYAVLVEKYPEPMRVDPYDPEPPFIVKMCDLLDAYDKATSWRDFKYPTWTMQADAEHEGVPTCVRCSGA